MAVTRTADTDDDGTGTTGTIHNNSWKQTTLYDAMDARWSEVTTTSTGTQNNFSISEGDVLRCNNASLLTLNGIVAPASPAKPGKRLWVVSVGAGQVDLSNQNASSTAANRIITGVTGTVSLAPGTGRACLVYDDTTDRWRVVVHEQGAYITRTFSAGDFTGAGAMTVTVASGDVVTDAYYLKGRKLSYQVELTTFTTGGTANAVVQIAIPGGLTAAKTTRNAAVTANNGGAFTGGWLVATASSAVIGGYRDDTFTSTWANGTDNNDLRGQIAIEVQ